MVEVTRVEVAAGPDDPTYGYDRADLLRVGAPEGPEDFAAFWTTTYEETLRIPLRLELRRVASRDPRVDLFEVEFDSLGEVRIGGWITVPADVKFESGAVIGHGYGGRDAPSYSIPGPPAAAIFPCARGFHRSARADFPDAGHRHVLHGIGSRETYVHRGCVADLWCAASALLELFPDAARALRYQGGSFGGGIGALALPWDARFHRAHLDVPSFGNHPLRVQLPCAGSGESVRIRWQQHPEVLDVLQYFDAATAARHISIPVFVAAALADGAVPPPGQFAVYNALAGARELYVRTVAHLTDPAEDDRIFALLAQWFQPSSAAFASLAAVG